MIRKINTEKLLPYLKKFEEGYYFYSNGRVWRSARTNGHGHVIELDEPVIASSPTKRGYRRVALGRSMVYEHLLIYAHFKGIGALGCIECVDHINANKGDNRIENLEGVSARENNERAERLGLVTRTYGEVNGCCKLTSSDVDSIRELHSAGENQYVLANLFHVGQGTISSIVNFKARKYG